MSKKFSLFKLLLPLAVFLALSTALSTPGTVSADDPAPPPDNGTCVTCHEDLYYLHDMGNWFCLEESPMTCVDCHGGDSNTLDKELAHLERTAHPVINEDVTKCQQCHPNECTERVGLFDQTAGISEISVAAPYVPAYTIHPTDVLPAAVEPSLEPGFLMMFWEILPLALLTGLALAAYFLSRRKRVQR